LRHCWGCGLLLALATLSLLATCQPLSAAEGDEARLVSVPIVAATQSSLPRTTTQPATIHAYYNARIHAMTSGYLLADAKAEIGPPVEIGQPVKAGDVLAVIDVPELDKRLEAKRADILRLEAEEGRAKADLTVAHAGTEAQTAKVEQSRAELAAADAATTAAKAEWKRVTDLVREKAVAGRLLDEATEKLESAEASKKALESAVQAAISELALARAQAVAADHLLLVAKAATEVARRELDEMQETRELATLRAPFDGVVTERNVDLGDLVHDTRTGGDANRRPLFVVTQLDPVRVRVAVPERDAPLVDVGDEVRLTLQALGSQVFTGSVARIAGALDERTRTMLVEIDLANADGQLMPGMFGQATITLEEIRDKTFLPAAVVRYDESGKSYVYVVDENDQIDVVDLQVGWDTGELVEIVTGLNGDERIVGPMLGRLKQGQKVRVE
jgi:RND family efflux transporter MFP subunit